MRSQNIVLFSSGVSENAGILKSVVSALEHFDYKCVIWRELFDGANDPKNIALLPMLIKKIPTFDFAVLICEGHDRTKIRRGEKEEIVYTMRDNVLFEIGLCTMALGVNRTVLVTDGKARLPEDLRGKGESTAVKMVRYDHNAVSYDKASAETAEYIRSESELQNLSLVAGTIDSYIKENAGIITPTVIGASVSTANGYVSNFILRTLEKCCDGVILMIDGMEQLRHFEEEKIFMHIVLPERYAPETYYSSRAMIRSYPKGWLTTTRYRRVEFRYYLLGDELHIVDFPTTLVTGYQTARLILKMDADDREDKDAEERFNAKELDLFENALRIMLSEKYIRETVVNFYEDDSPEEEEALIQKLMRMIERVSVERKDY